MSLLRRLTTASHRFAIGLVITLAAVLGLGAAAFAADVSPAVQGQIFATQRPFSVDAFNSKSGVPVHGRSMPARARHSAAEDARARPCRRLPRPFWSRR